MPYSRGTTQMAGIRVRLAGGYLLGKKASSKAPPSRRTTQTFRFAIMATAKPVVTLSTLIARVYFRDILAQIGQLQKILYFSGNRIHEINAIPFLSLLTPLFRQPVRPYLSHLAAGRDKAF